MIKAKPTKVVVIAAGPSRGRVGDVESTDTQAIETTHGIEDRLWVRFTGSDTPKPFARSELLELSPALANQKFRLWLSIEMRDSEQADLDDGEPIALSGAISLGSLLYRAGQFGALAEKLGGAGEDIDSGDDIVNQIISTLEALA